MTSAPLEALKPEYEQWAEPKELVLIEGGTHFFDRQLARFADALAGALQASARGRRVEVRLPRKRPPGARSRVSAFGAQPAVVATPPALAVESGLDVNDHVGHSRPARAQPRFDAVSDPVGIRNRHRGIDEDVKVEVDVVVGPARCARCALRARPVPASRGLDQPPKDAPLVGERRQSVLSGSRIRRAG